MATNKQAQIRYNALDRCFSNFGRKYDINNLVEACNQAIYEYDGKLEGVKKRQVYEDIKFMESSQGYNVELDKIKDGRRVYYRYTDRDFSINQSPLNPVEVSQIHEVLLMLSRFRGMPQFEWVVDITAKLKGLSKGGLSGPDKIVDFEQNQDLEGLSHIPTLFNAIYNRRVLRVTYKPFTRMEHIIHIFHSYYLKQYNLRWFVFGKSAEESRIVTLALDRIEVIKETSDAFIPNTEIDFSEYFYDAVGVSIPENAQPEKVVLFVTSKRWPYIATKPLHLSQKKPKFVDGGVTTELKVIVNNELVQKLLSFGEDIVVLAPEHLKTELKNTAKAMSDNYN